ncbi:MAG: squalene/phytoene synthase family protein [Magnetovibrio sp.]|nr:squalene/phytoene synthase family protein [Magnetovibrio sp.]
MIETQPKSELAKGAGDENFPVASKLLPAWSRPHVMAYYAFARAADDVADAADLSAAKKLRSLWSMHEQLKIGTIEPSAKVYALHQSLNQTGVSFEHGQNLLEAFVWDVEHPRTADWDALIDYCALSAAPVGRYLIDLLGGCEGDYRASDALCAALQILNHLQDLKDDLIELDRIYVPLDWMVAAGIKEGDLIASSCTPALRGVLDQMLDGVDALLEEAKPLPGAIHSKALAREAGGILAIARRLAKALRRQDPVAQRVELSKPMMALCFVWGALNA